MSSFGRGDDRDRDYKRSSQSRSRGRSEPSTRALKMFNMSIGKRGRQNILWEMVKCQEQPDGRQCGFYVMRYMRDIIEGYGSDNTIAIPTMFSNGFYSKKEIDEVRIEWSELVADSMVVDDDEIKLDD